MSIWSARTLAYWPAWRDELIFVRLASGELAFDRLLRFQLHRFDGLHGRDVTAGLCQQSAGRDNEERKARGQALHRASEPFVS